MDAIANLWKANALGFSKLREGKLRFARYKWIIQKLPPPPANILEIGFNSGMALQNIHLRGYACTGIDLPRVVSSLKIADMDHPDITYHGINIDGWDNKWWMKFQEEFDIIIMCEVLQHTVFDMDILFGISHMLKPQGHFFITTENVKLVKNAVRYYPTDVLEKMLQILDFKIVEVTTTGQSNYIWIHAKKA